MRVVDDGRFVGSTTSTPSCSDSDGGINYVVKRMVYGQDSNFTNYFFNDTCSGNSVMEYYCNVNTSSFASINYNCANLGADYDCNGGECLQQTNATIYIYYCDYDADAYRSSVSSGSCETSGCIPSGCSSAQGNDCNDNNTLVHPGVAELCNAVDDNCKLQIDEGCGNQTCSSETSLTKTIVEGSSATAFGINIGLYYVDEDFIMSVLHARLIVGSQYMNLSIGGSDPSFRTITINGNIYTITLTSGSDSEANIKINECVPTVTCTDSDGGINYYVAGNVTTCTFGNQTGGCGMIQDRCSGSDLTEYSCQDGQRRQSGMFCAAMEGYTCSNGACVQIQQTCSVNSSDVKEVPEGATKAILGLNVYVASADENNLILRAMISVDGQYLNLSVGGFDPSSKIISVDGWQYKIELVTASDTVATIRVGFCVSNTALSCSDSDGGWYPYARGTATVGSNPELRYTDFCLSSNGTAKTLHEYSCAADNTLAGGNFECPYGCSEGVCKSKSLPNPCPWWKFWKKCGAIAEIQSAASEK